MKHFQNFLRDIGLDRATREDYRATIAEIKRSHASTFRQYWLMALCGVVVFTPLAAYMGFSATASLPSAEPWLGWFVTAMPLAAVLVQLPNMNRMIWRQIRDGQESTIGAPQSA